LGAINDASYHEKGLAWLEETKSALCT
jgi:hypothetical protein